MMKKILKITTISILSFIILLILFMTLGILITNKPQMQQISYEPTALDFWPTQGWQTSTPEEQGMDSAKLLGMVEFYEKQHLKNGKISIDSITIVQNGVCRLTETNNNTYAAVGSWTSPNTFSIDYEIIGYTTKDRWNFTFDEDEILVEEVGVTGKYHYGGKIKQHEN